MLQRVFLVLACLLILAVSSTCSDGKARTMVGVYYFPGWYRDKPAVTAGGFQDSSEWRNAIAKAAHPRPVCGFYDDSNPRVWDYFDRWMGSHGIDFIAFDWYYNNGEQYISDSLDKGFLGCKSSDKAKFCLHWCNHGGPWWSLKFDQSAPTLEKMVDLAYEKYFKRPNYLRIDGKPVFMIYETDMLSNWGSGVKIGLEAMRKRARERGLPGLYIVSVYSGADAAEIERRARDGYDAFCAYTNMWLRGPKMVWDSPTFDYVDITENIIANAYPYLARVAKREGITYWPSTFSGWDDRPRAGLEKAYVLLDNTPKQFGRLFRGALGHVDPKCPIVMVEAWNEWGEGACIEPSKEHGFGYVSEIARALGFKKPDESVPSAAEIASWSVLSPEELVVAKSNESKPWPVRPAHYYKMGKSRKVAPVKLPVTLDFALGGVEFTSNEIKVENRDSSGLTFVSTGGDPQIAVSTPEIPTSQIKRITADVDITMPSGRPSPTVELYFATALLPDFTSFAVTTLPAIADGTTSLAASEIMAWRGFGTPLIGIRIDPGGEPGVRVRLKRLILAGE